MYEKEAWGTIDKVGAGLCYSNWPETLSPIYYITGLDFRLNLPGMYDSFRNTGILVSFNIIYLQLLSRCAAGWITACGADKLGFTARMRFSEWRGCLAPERRVSPFLPIAVVLSASSMEIPIANRNDYNA